MDVDLIPILLVHLMLDTEYRTQHTLDLPLNICRLINVPDSWAAVCGSLGLMSKHT